MTDRRTFLKGTLLGSLIVSSTHAHARGTPMKDQWISIIDLDLCDGCANLDIPACVLACKQKNQSSYPVPQKPLRPYWPQKKYEDFSEHQDRIDRLTPYNWLYIEKINVGNKTIYAPRRCMHCFDAPCRKVCPFGAIDKSSQGAVGINPNVCFGGAKCRDVCPWEIPQRQAGVGLYLDLAPKFAGGGVMYKCDFCADLLQKGIQPSCAQVCPKGAMRFLPLKQATSQIQKLAEGRYIYGQEENGGTATWYISSVSFKDLLKAQGGNKAKGKVDGKPTWHEARPELDLSASWAKATLATPIVAIGAAYVLHQRKKTNKNKSSSSEA